MLSVKRLILYPMLSLVGIMTWWACASPQPLKGGDPDTTPPALIEEASTPNRQTRFTEKEIVLTFDEWTVLKDINKQLIISPLMPGTPEIRQKGKSIIIELPDSLRENTTYSLQFGSAITDLNEGNILSNYSFVFSTGDVLDSISLSGYVEMGDVPKPAVGILILVHPADRDSNIFLHRPDYVAKTDSSGHWRIDNMRVDHYEIYVLRDENLNYLYDPDTEWFGWKPEKVYADTSKETGTIRVFQQEKRDVIVNALHPQPGKLMLEWPGQGVYDSLNFQPPLEILSTWRMKDTVHILYDPTLSYVGQVIWHGDTTQIRAATGSDPLQSKMKVAIENGRLHPQQILRLRSDIPMTNINPDRFAVTQDTIQETAFEIHTDSIDQKIIYMRSAWKPGSRYRIEIWPGGLQDIWGRVNDTIRLSFVTLSSEDFGVLYLQVSQLDSTRQYLVDIVSTAGIQESYTVRDTSQTLLVSGPLFPGKYTVEIVEDRNRNGRWDTGDYTSGRQPEWRQIYPLDNLRADWDLEATVVWRKPEE